MSDPVSILPAIVTQENSLAAVGMPGRAFREYIRAKRLKTIRFGKRNGKLVGVELADLLAALRADAEESAAPSNDIELIRAAAGLRVVGGT